MTLHFRVNDNKFQTQNSTQFLVLFEREKKIRVWAEKTFYFESFAVKVKSNKKGTDMYACSRKLGLFLMRDLNI